MKLEELTKIPLFSETDPVLLDRCLGGSRSHVRRYARGATVHHQHETCTALDVVIAGNLAAYSLAENGSAVTMFEFRENGILGANLLFGENRAYPLNIYSVTACELLQLTQTEVKELLHDYHFVMQYIKSLSANSQGMNRKITMLTQKTLRENLLDYLRQQSSLQNSSSIILPISKKELADHLGVQRPSLFRELKKLKGEGILEIENRSVRIKF